MCVAYLMPYLAFRIHTNTYNAHAREQMVKRQCETVTTSSKATCAEEIRSAKCKKPWYIISSIEETRWQTLNHRQASPLPPNSIASEPSSQHSKQNTQHLRTNANKYEMHFWLHRPTGKHTGGRSTYTHNTSSKFLTSGISSRRERDREQDNTKLTKNRKQLRPVVCSTDTYQNGCVWNGLNHNNQKQQQTNKRTNGVKKKIIERGRQEEYHPIGISLECAPLEIEHHWNTHRNHGNTSVSVCYRLPTQRNSSNDAAEWWMMLTTAAIQHQQQHKKKEEIFRTEHQQQRGYYCVIKNQI